MKSIRVENLKYKYPNSDTFALSNISFTIEKGEFIGIVGRIPQENQHFAMR